MDEFPTLAFRIGKYQIESLLGRGGHGLVYLASDPFLHRKVALKVPRPEFAAMTQFREALLAEARIGALFENAPGFCRIYEYGSADDGTPFLAMQYIEGTSLADFRRLNRRTRDAIEIMRKIACILSAYHDGGWIHRDLKPANVQLRADLSPILIDLGLAIRLCAAGCRLPGRGELDGTPHYMAPEQIDPGRVPLSVRSDIFSLGVILYELVAGRRPFEAKDLPTLADRICTHEPDPLTSIDPKFESIGAVCRRAMAKDPKDRYVSTTEFRDDLAACLAGKTPPAAMPRVGAHGRPLLDPNRIRFDFVHQGSVAPADLAGRNRLFLDVGNDLRPGVIDHHHLVSNRGSSAGVVVNRLDLIDAAVAADADETTIVVHQWPDMDCLVSAYLARAYLTTGKLPDAAPWLIEYADHLDAGYSHVSADRPFTLHAAYMRLLSRLDDEPDKRGWTQAMEQGFRLLEHVADTLREDHAQFVENRASEVINAIDAFVPELFDDGDRAFIHGDRDRYEATFRDPGITRRIAALRLPAQFGPRRLFPALLVRDLPNRDDPRYVLFYKDWARSDAGRCPGGRGFVALSVFFPEMDRRPRRCILSVAPESEASLRGLGEALDERESQRRIDLYGFDDRVRNARGELMDPRPGYAYSDPWYDGRGHNYTIVDSPHGGTVLTADEIEAAFLEYGTPT